MLSIADSIVDKKLKAKEEKGLLRNLKDISGLTDFCSNDYLGFSKILGESIVQYDGQFGSTGSRLVSGNSSTIIQTEKAIALFHQAENALIFNSGYDANLGLFSSIGQKGTTILYDEQIHASIRDGIRLSFAKAFKFEHNNLLDLKRQLQNAKGEIFVAIESVYSILGDQAKLKSINALCKQYEASLIVDEAHAIGVFGEQGKGLVCECNLQDDIFARVVTFGKALGCHGAAVLSSKKLRTFLINHARSFIYTTALPEPIIRKVQEAYLLLEKDAQRPILQDKIEYFKNEIKLTGRKLTESNGPIQCVHIGSAEDSIRLQIDLEKKGLAIKAMLPPTVKQGQECIRICIHAFNTEEEIDFLVQNLRN